MQREHDDTHRLRCAYCGYDLFGLPSAVCPECGNDFDPELMEPLQNAGLIVAAASLSVGMAVICVCLVIHLALDEVQSWGGWGRCCRRGGIDGAAVLVFLAHPLFLLMLWLAREDSICRRIVINALLAVITSWIGAMAILATA